MGPDRIADPAAGHELYAAAGRERSIVAQAVGDRVVPALMVVACLAGVVGLELPVVEALGEAFAFTMADIPYVGSCLLLLFVVLTLLPVIDTVRGRATFTPWLLLPALIGLVPLGLLEFGLSYVPGGVDLIRTVVPDAVVVLGVGPDVLLGANVAMTVLSAIAIVNRVLARQSRKREAASAPELLAPRGATAW